jgi:hypothetical protein
MPVRRRSVSPRWLAVAAGACLVVLLAAGTSRSADPGAKKKIEFIKAYQLFQEKCTLCHVSVADPEKPGRTRDDWQLVVEVMHGYGLALKPEETELIVDLLYELRRGIERHPG